VEDAAEKSRLNFPCHLRAIEVATLASSRQPDRVEVVSEGIAVAKSPGCARLEDVGNEELQVVVEHRCGAEQSKAQGNSSEARRWAISGGYGGHSLVVSELEHGAGFGAKR